MGNRPGCPYPAPLASRSFNAASSLVRPNQARSRSPRVTLHRTMSVAQRTRPQDDRTKATTVEISIVMPCLNEAETLATCIRKARRAIEKDGMSAEIIVADNG